MSRRKFAKPDSEEKILNKCPFCGGELEYSELYQYTKAYRILKNGKISKVVKYKEDNGSMGCGLISCSNPDCEDLSIKPDFCERNIAVYGNNLKRKDA